MKRVSNTNLDDTSVLVHFAGLSSHQERDGYNQNGVSGRVS